MYFHIIILIVGIYTQLEWEFPGECDRWVWLNGASTFGGYGVYGVKRVAAISNIPGARESHNFVAGGNASYLFGGDGYDYVGSKSFLDDLWKYDIITNMWTWVAGSKTVEASGVYGVKGVGTPLTGPGARFWQAVIGGENHLWLFGGYALDPVGGYANDLWKYTTINYTWTWVSGANTPDEQGVYGTINIADAANVPGARSTHALTLVGVNSLWLFGGEGFDSGGSNGNLNDLWHYNITTDLWTWRSGATVTGATGVYGSNGVPHLSNIPGCRSLLGLTSGPTTIWVFGGTGMDGVGDSGPLNDLWKYDISNNIWTWVSGSTIRRQVGDYGTFKTPGPTNTPGARVDGQLMLKNNEIWLFGGESYDSVGNIGTVNDLWNFVIVDTNGITVNAWRWVTGSSVRYAMGVYGTLGEYSPLNTPGARYTSSFITDNRIMMFGGNGYVLGGTGALNDVWRYNLPAFSCNDISCEHPGSCGYSGVCIDEDACICESKFYGDNCESVNFTVLEPPVECYGILSTDHFNVCGGGHGVCVSTNTCVCHSGYNGSNCSTVVTGVECYGITADDIDTVCGGHGYCLLPNVCVCNVGYNGPNCTTSLPGCFGIFGTEEYICSSHGSCMDQNICICDKYHTGNNCQWTKAPVTRWLCTLFRIFC